MSNNNNNNNNNGIIRKEKRYLGVGQVVFGDGQSQQHKVADDACEENEPRQGEVDHRRHLQFYSIWVQRARC
jgi:hypothetical protein